MCKYWSYYKYWQKFWLFQLRTRAGCIHYHSPFELRLWHGRFEAFGAAPQMVRCFLAGFGARQDGVISMLSSECCENDEIESLRPPPLDIWSGAIKPWSHRLSHAEVVVGPTTSTFMNACSVAAGNGGPTAERSLLILVGDYAFGRHRCHVSWLACFG